MTDSPEAAISSAPSGDAEEVRPTIRVQEAVKSFHSRVVVDIDDLTLGKYPIEGLIGPNGAGKTTLMRVISGLIRPSRGSVRMEGVDVVTTPAHKIVSLGIAHVPENRRLFPQLTVDDNLKMGAFMKEARGHYAERLDVVFELFPRLKERRHQMAGTMSGGEQQMCAIGRAMMSNPKLLLLDEPSAGLAPVVVQQVFELVKRIRASGLTVLIVEQNVQQVLKVVDRAYLIEAGTIRASGTSAEMLASDTVKEAYLGV